MVTLQREVIVQHIERHHVVNLVEVNFAHRKRTVNIHRILVLCEITNGSCTGRLTHRVDNTIFHRFSHLNHLRAPSVVCSHGVAFLICTASTHASVPRHEFAVAVNDVVLEECSHVSFERAHHTVGIVFTAHVFRISIGNVSHTEHVVDRVHVIRTLSQVRPTEVWIHLVLVAPLVAESPNSIGIMITHVIRIQDAILCIVHERHAHTALIHVVVVVHKRQSLVLRHATELFETYQIMLPSDEAVKNVHHLNITASGVLLQGADFPARVNAVAIEVNSSVARVIENLLQFIVRLMRSQVTVHLSIDEVHLHVGSAIGIAAVIGDISQAWPIARLVDDVDTVTECISFTLIPILSICVIIRIFLRRPTNYAEAYGFIFGYTVNDDSRLTLGQHDTRHTLDLIIELARSTPFGRKRLRVKQALVRTNAELRIVVTRKNLCSQSTNERIA